jgi:hypothetical protein
MSAANLIQRYKSPDCDAAHTILLPDGFTIKTVSATGERWRAQE